MTSLSLKITALVLMTIDHIGAFIPGIPIIFRWLGRLSAPIFVFCCAWSMDFTKNRKKYMTRLYLANVAMGTMNYLFSVFSNINVDNNIFRTLFLMTVLIYIYDTTRNNTRKRVLLFSAFFLIEIVLSGLMFWLAYVGVLDSELIMQCISSVLGLFLGIESLTFSFLGLGIYIWKEDKRKFQIWYIVFCVLFSLFGFLQIIPRINLRTDDVYFEILETIARDMGLTSRYRQIDISYFFLENFQWMMIFALPLMSLFYRKKDKYQKPKKQWKYFFYLYYPIHLYVLSFIGTVLVQ